MRATRPTRIGSLFDLKWAEYDASTPIDDIPLSQQGVTLSRILNPTREQIDHFLRHSFYFKTAEVLYACSLSYPDPEANFLSTLTAKRARDFKRVDRDVNALIEGRDVELVVDRGQYPELLEAFVHYHFSKMNDKLRGRQLLRRNFKNCGSPIEFYKQYPLLLYLLSKNRTMLGGLAASWRGDGYSISFSASETSVGKTRNVQLFLVQKLVHISALERCSAVYYGIDTNLYGHHLSPGLAAYKASVGFAPILHGKKELLRFDAYTPFSFPILFFEKSELYHPTAVIISSDMQDPMVGLLTSHFLQHRFLCP